MISFEVGKGSYPIWDTPEFKLKFTMSMKWVYAMFNSMIQKHAAWLPHSAFQAPESASLQPRPAQKLTIHLYFSVEVFQKKQEWMMVDLLITIILPQAIS